MNSLIDLFRENDKVRVSDPKHPDFDQVGTITMIKGVYYYVLLDDTTEIKLRRPQFQRV